MTLRRSDHVYCDRQYPIQRTVNHFRRQSRFIYMAVQWQKTVNGNRYEVRNAGRTRRLYTNGVCHSEFNPVRLLTGSIWDLLTITAFFAPRDRVRRVLALGVGGGASLLQLRRLIDPERIVGIEADPVHLLIARRFFAAADAGLELVQAEAGAWLDGYRGEPFDLILEDLFGGTGGEPERAVTANAGWFRKLERHLHDEGTLAVNFASRDELKSCGYFQDARLSSRFQSAYSLTTPGLDNVVGAFLRSGVPSASLRANLRGNPALNRALRERRLRYRIRGIVRNVGNAA